MLEHVHGRPSHASPLRLTNPTEQDDKLRFVDRHACYQLGLLDVVLQ